MDWNLWNFPLLGFISTGRLNINTFVHLWHAKWFIHDTLVPRLGIYQFSLHYSKLIKASFYIAAGGENKNKIHSYTFDPRVKSMQNGLTWMTFCDPTISTISRFGLQNVVNKTIEGIVQSEYFSALQTMLEKHSRHSKKAPWRIPSMTAWRRSNWLNQSTNRILRFTVLWAGQYWA